MVYFGSVIRKLLCSGTRHYIDWQVFVVVSEERVSCTLEQKKEPKVEISVRVIARGERD
jgi:hypothetical protein